MSPSLFAAVSVPQRLAVVNPAVSGRAAHADPLLSSRSLVLAALVFDLLAVAARVRQRPNPN